MRARPTLVLTILVTLAACREQPAATTTTDASSEAPAASPAAAPAPAETPPAGTGDPDLDFEVTSIDLGRVVDAAVYSGSYPFRNAGTAPLEIRQVRPNCGCTQASASRSIVAPGESASIDFVYDPKTLRGRNFSQIQVVSNDPDFRVATLALNASVTPLFSTRPPFLRMGEKQLGVEHRHEINGYFRDEHLEVESIHSTHPAVSGMLKERLGQVTEDADGNPIHGVSIDVVVAAEAPWGSLHDARLTFVVLGRGRPEDEPVERRYSIPVYADLFGDLQAFTIGAGGELRPSSIFGIGNVHTNTAFETTVRLARASGGPLEIREARVFASSLPDVTVETTRLGDATWQLLLRGTSGGTTGQIRGEIVVETNLPAPEDRVRLPMTGMVY